jgi:O-methyltransferase
MGYVLYRMEGNGEPLRPMATYAPWNKDKHFLEIYAAIDGYSLIDKFRLYELWTLVEQSQKLSGGIIEVGAWRGGSAALLATKAKACGILAPVYICDTFTGVVKASDKDTEYEGGEHSDTSRALVEDFLSQKMRLDNVKILQGIFPDDTGNLVENETFRLCHIDVDTYQSACDVSRWIWPRLVVGGMIVHDDYGFRGTPGITQHVNEQLSCPDRLVLYNLNGHAIIIKIR